MRSMRARLRCNANWEKVWISPKHCGSTSRPHQLQTLYHILEDLLKPLGPQQQSVVTKALAKGWGVAPPKSKAESYATGMHLVQRMSECRTAPYWVGCALLLNSKRLYITIEISHLSHFQS